MGKKNSKSNSKSKTPKKSKKKTLSKKRKGAKIIKNSGLTVKSASKVTNNSNLNSKKQEIEQIEEDFKNALEGIELERNMNNNKKKEKITDINIKQFLHKTNSLKTTVNYKQKGPFIYCAVKRELRLDYFKDLSPLLYKLDLYHVGVFEATKKILIHYGEEDKNKIKKPLGLEPLNENDYTDYSVIKYFYSKIEPHNFINLIDKNDWTTERFDELCHNCIHCTNEYLILNNITPIRFGLGKDIAYKRLCEKCLKYLGRSKMYVEMKSNVYNIETEFDKEEYKEFVYRCERCLDEDANWEYNFNWLQNSEEEEEYYIPEIENRKNLMEEIKKFKQVGESLSNALIKVRIKNIPKYQYAVIRKNLFFREDEQIKNYGFIALASLHENKIIEYGNEKYNNGGPILRDIDEEDKYLYHTVSLFTINEKSNELFNSINLTPWKPERYDVFYYNSYNFINIYLHKYNQKIFLITNRKIFNSAFLHLCRECYKNMNWPECYIHRDGYGVPYRNNNNNNKEDNIWWCWNCGKSKARFHFIGRPFNLKYDYLCEACYYYLAEPYNYMKINKPVIKPNNYYLMGIINIQSLTYKICSRCLNLIARYKLINSDHIKMNDDNKIKKIADNKLDAIKMNADIAFQNAADTWKQGIEKIKQVPETIKNTLQQASQRWDEFKKEHPDFIRNGKILFSCLLDYIPYVGNFKACFELKTEKDLITKEELDDIDKTLSYISVGIPAFKSINKIIKVPFTKTYKFFEGVDDYGGFVKSLYDMCDGDE